MKPILILALLSAALILAGAHAAAAPAGRPNVLIILADDLGFSDIGCYGSEIATPNLDKLAMDGLRYSQFYNTARCWPTRGALMTGFYAQQIRRDAVPGVVSGGRGQRQEWARLLPDMLRPLGYRSYHAGKWHIDGSSKAGGFDRSYRLEDHGRYFNAKAHFEDDQKLPPIPPDKAPDSQSPAQKDKAPYFPGTGTGYYATTATADYTIKYLKEHAASHADKPFFTYLAFIAPHFPLHALPQDIEKYKGAYTKGWDAAREARWQRMKKMGLVAGEPSAPQREVGPPYAFPDAMKKYGPNEVNRPVPWNELTDEQKAFAARKMAIHAAMIDRMDVEIGRVLDQLRAMNAFDNTLIFFLSDNGASAEMMVRDDGHDSSAPAGSATTYLCLGPGWSTVSNTPFRYHKTWTHEGGIATPLIAHWPKGIAARGEVRQQVGHVIDIVPTVLEAAGGSALKEWEGKPVPASPGKSLAPTFADKDAAGRSETWWQHEGNRAIRVGNWKLVAAGKDAAWELYDLATDRVESRNLAKDQPQRVEELAALWQKRADEYYALAKQDLPKDAPAKEKLKPKPNASAAPATSNAGSPFSRGPLGRATPPAQFIAAQATTNPPAKDAKPPAKPVKNLILPGEAFLVNDRPSFIFWPDAAKRKTPQPWVFYGPTLPGYPDSHEKWMHEKFLDAGIAVAGIDIGEAYGSPAGRKHFTALYEELTTKRGFSKKPVMLGRSRGGLWTSSWAVENPDKVAGLAGIYPVYDFRTYPGLKNAAPAYGLKPEELEAKLAEHNPIERVHLLAKGKVPVCIIHGDDDKVVPLQENSAELLARYKAAGEEKLVNLIIAKGQGHNFWEGFFRCQELVDFVIDKAK